jgi:hypothetical protein
MRRCSKAMKIMKGVGMIEKVLGTIGKVGLCHGFITMKELHFGS